MFALSFKVGQRKQLQQNPIIINSTNAVLTDQPVVPTGPRLRGGVVVFNYDARLRLYSGDHCANSSTELANVDDSYSL